MALAPGTEVAGYRVIGVIASGGMGEVYEATQLSLERRVALKVISAELAQDPGFRERFRREARAAASIEHPSILAVHETGETADGHLFIVSRFIDGPDLRSYVDDTGPLAPEVAVEVLTQVGDALDAAHAAGFVHRDVKPANVLIETSGDARRAYLTDFGLAKPVESPSELTVAGQIVGTVDYMAPEQIQGDPVDGRADVYALGCTLYWCLTGRTPFGRMTSPATLLAHLNDPIPLPSQQIAGLPTVFDTSVQRALEKNPDRRARSAGELMRFAARRLPATRGEATAPASTVLASAGSPTEPAAPPVKPRFARQLAYHVLAYAPLWAGAYLLGRSL